MEFLESKYYLLDNAFNLSEYADSKKALSDWKKTNKKKRVVEENLETIMHLYFSELTGIKNPIYISRATFVRGGGEDIRAVDQFKRIHSIEIKNKKLTIKCFEQLMRYMQDKNYVDADKYIKNRLKENNDLSVEDLVLLFAGVITNKRIDNIGIGVINNALKKNIAGIKEVVGFEKIGRSRYTKLGSKKKALLAKILLNNDLEYERIKAIANFWYNKFNEPKSTEYKYAAVKKGVFWLIGSEVDKKVQKVQDEILRLRGTGEDFRIILIDMRYTQKGKSWILKVEYENFTEREQIENDLLNNAESITKGEVAPTITLNFYEHNSASTVNKNGGKNLKEPFAFIKVGKKTERFPRKK
ncbi:MAG: hypothetical protein KF816_06340 [Melioribacteraceae bacterium]|nr:hypothetical protein [Melioribacteraceae bacterium]